MVAEGHRLGADRKHAGIEPDDVACDKLGLEGRLGVDDGQRQTARRDLARPEPERGLQGEHALADGGEVMLHVHVPQMVALGRHDIAGKGGDETAHRVVAFPWAWVPIVPFRRARSSAAAIAGAVRPML